MYLVVSMLCYLQCLGACGAVYEMLEPRAMLKARKKFVKRPDELAPWILIACSMLRRDKGILDLVR